MQCSVVLVLVPPPSRAARLAFSLAVSFAFGLGHRATAPPEDLLDTGTELETSSGEQSPELVFIGTGHLPCDETHFVSV
ncbi:hypothetical protein K466DRAFT_606818 [Polyporus arcularius HHB13444]|uniref:Uncharacterized protein n=1 Tax=Polyporus arcularius HHB13444 TaxID=1314778 RepID=A0A5C3NQH2_9APHY|nr:hypothetical protein K466DRAFT_606818 [Polyporus arcularius HHB13444]